MKTSRAVWEKSLAALQEQMTPISYKTWITPIQPICIKDNTLVLQAENETSKNTLRSLYTQMVTDAVNRANGTGYLVRFIDEAERGDYPDPNAGKTAYSSDFTLNPKYTFESFVIGSSNNFAHAAAQAVADNPSSAYNPLFIYGGVGLGKTHLMHAIGHFIQDHFPNMRMLYLPSEMFTNELVAAIKNNKNVEFRNRFRNVDVLMLDDIQFIAGRDSTQEEFFHTFNSLHDAHKQIVIASDRPAKEIKSLEERLRTRFEWGLTADVQPPDFETRVAIVKRKAELLHLDLPEDVAEFIANHLKNNIRQLEGAVKKLNAYYMLEGIQPVISVAQNAIKDILNETQPVPVTIEKIIGEVSRTFNVSPADIRGTKRNANVASARRVAIYILREVTGMSMEEIGREFSGRDHSTIVYSLKTMERDMKNDQHLRETVSDIIKNVKA